MSSTGGALTSADSPPSMSRLSCRSTWPIRRFSVTLASRPPPRIAVSTAVMTVHSCLTCSLAAARSRFVQTRSSSSRKRAGSAPLIQPSSAAWNAGRKRCATLSKPRPMSAPPVPAPRRRGCRSNGPAVQQHERAFGQRRLVARLTQVVQQRQQRQRDVLAAAEQPLEIRGQLHHRTRQRFDALLGLLLVLRLGQAAGTSAPFPLRAAPRRGSRRSSAPRARHADARPCAATRRRRRGRRRSPRAGARAASSVLASSRLTSSKACVARSSIA